MEGHPVKRDEISNREIADRLDHVADLLELEEENAFRVRSYRNAAQTVRDMDQPVAELVRQDGDQALQALPGIGQRLAGSIKEIATTGHLGLEEKLESEIWPGKLFTEVPGEASSTSARL
jgi:DNA polymerase (family 10)